MTISTIIPTIFLSSFFKEVVVRKLRLRSDAKAGVSNRKSLEKHPDIPAVAVTTRKKKGANLVDVEKNSILQISTTCYLHLFACKISASIQQNEPRQVSGMIRAREP